MRIITTLAIVLLSFVPAISKACSCFGPPTFCETLNPQYEPPIDPSWWVPDHIVLGVKLTTVEYGVDLKVVQDFNGGLEVNEIIRVWGDCGFLCRLYNTGPADGDTVLWAIQSCDLSGNGGCGPSVEQSDHFQLSACGVYWLDYANGIISGPLYTEGASETISLEDFATLVGGCLSTGVNDPVALGARVQCVEGQLTITTTGSWAELKNVFITDAAGRMLYAARFAGTGATMALPRRMIGLMLVRVSDHERSVTHKLLFD